MSRGTGAPSAPTQDQLDAVHDALGRLGPDEWVTHGFLARHLAMGERKVRLCARELVKLGVPLITGANGYRLERDPEKVRDAAGRMRHRGLAVLERAAALERWAKAEEEKRASGLQPSLFAFQQRAEERDSAR